MSVTVSRPVSVLGVIAVAALAVVAALLAAHRSALRATR